ncbi:permease YjgP/YjgQ family protein [Dissulfurispira thermophila]|uniref:Permease YjgP/YjgQ family protein n=1 Tax=Dissulfurispira thermophila TaxID=2715679 RepID=A0A7G1GYF9_9BACT|nr:LptF/LptG family permease [Dissulfurispira thermophila]BCB95228.1 permease YjgP/YjgQ family protein [Dissulfurispira thermophila]
MLIIQRLYIKEFLKVLLILTFGISAVFSIIGLIDKIDDFMPYKPSFNLLMLYTALSIPKYTNYLLPMSILLSSLFIFSQAIKRREIIAIKAATGKMKKVLIPFVIIGIILTSFAFLLGEIIVPTTSKKLHSIKNKIIKKERGLAFKEGTLYIRGKDGSIVRISLYLPDKNISKGVSIFKFDEEGLKERLDAETGLWKDNVWKLKDVTLYDIAKGQIRKIKEAVYPAIESPKIFQEDMWKVEEMTIIEMVKYKQRLDEAGFKNIKLLVDISSRLSYPLINLFMLLLGISLSLGGDFRGHWLLKLISSQKIKEGTLGSGIIAAGLGLLISLVYWFGYSLFLSLGYAGAISPLIAPWVVPIIFAVISVYLYSQIPE